jgi:hypothetical protein
MGIEIKAVETIRQMETTVPGPNGANRFVTIIGSMRIRPRPGEGTETYTCLLGPVLTAHECLCVSFLPSIAALNLATADLAECSVRSYDAQWDADSGQVRISIEVFAAGAIGSATIVFSLTILVAS